MLQNNRYFCGSGQANVSDTTGTSVLRRVNQITVDNTV
jgi:hypothetical protein